MADGFSSASASAVQLMLYSQPPVSGGDHSPEPLLSLAQVSKLAWLPRRRRAKRPCISTIWRWIKHGTFGVRLRATSVGTTLCVRESDLREFFDAIARRREVAP